MLLVIILLISIILITFVLYVLTLVNFIINNNMNIVILLLSLLINYILTYITSKLIIKKYKNHITLNMENNFNNLFGFYVYNIATLFGISLIVNSLLFGFNFLNLLVGTILVIFDGYVIYEYIFNYKKIKVIVDVIDNVNKNTFLLYLRDKDEKNYEYYVKDDNYNIDKEYICVYNIFSNEIRRIDKEV